MAVYKFYDGTNWVELAKKSDIPSLSGYATETWVGNNYVKLSSSGTQFVNATSTNIPMSFQGNSTGSCLVGFYNSNQTGLGFIGVKSGNVPYFYNPVSQEDHNIVLDSDVVLRLNWWNVEDFTKSANDMLSGITFAYSQSHNTPATGTIATFSCKNDLNYPLQIQGGYSTNKLYYRNRNGDNGTWQSWKEIASAENVVEKTKIIADQTDVNNIVESGFYRFYGGATNIFPSGSYSQLIVSRGENTMAQIGVSYSTEKMYVRAGANVSDNGASWTGKTWKRVMYDVDFQYDSTTGILNIITT